MKIKSTLVLAVVGLFFVQLFSSCNSSFDITKRRYNKGFYVDMGGSSKSNQARVERAKTPTVTAATPTTVTTVATTPGVNEIREQINTLTAGTKNIIARKAIRKVARQLEAMVVTASAEERNTSVSSETSVKKDVTEQKDMKKSSGGGKSQVIALILVIFLGGLGIHRFYLGYTWQGIVQLLTAGGCGVWALIDLIRIITGDLQPKDGRYDKTL